MAIPKGKGYFGNIVVDFNLKKKPEAAQPLFMDYFGNSIDNLQINGKTMDSKKQFQNGTVILMSENLKLGANTVKMNFINEYRNDGYGFHSFTD